MTFVRALVLVVACLAVQAGLARLWPASTGWVDVLALPVLWFSIARSQRSGMLVGCVSGLAYDAWFGAGVFGMTGFMKTFLGWAVGAIGSRIDLSPGPSRFATTVVFVWLQGPLEIGLRRLLDQHTSTPSVLEWTVRALLTGLLVALAFPILGRVAPEEREVDYAAGR